MLQIMHLFFLLLGLSPFATSDDLPTLYEYYTTDGVSSGLSVDQPYFTLNGKNITIYSGAMHYFRVPSQYWQDRLRKLRATGLNTVETYIPWNLHEFKNNVFDFGDGGSDYQRLLDLDLFLTLAKQEDLFVIARPGPYICAEWEWGGLPSWLLREEAISVRTSDPVYMKYVKRYFDKLLPILAKHQFTKRGAVIAVQVENEYASAPIEKDHAYLQQLVDLMKDNGIVELLVTSDGAGYGTDGTLPGVLFQTVNFGSDAKASFSKLEEMQPNKPLMAMEFYPGWFDHWSETHHTVSNSSFVKNYEEVLAYPASINLYMFHGGTNFGFLNGANIGSGDNSNFQPTTTSYDYDAPLSEAGDYTDKYEVIRTLIKKYNPVQTKTPDPPELYERQVYPTLAIEGQLGYNDIIRQAPSTVLSTSDIPMENLPINDNSGQSYGYIVYRASGIDIPANSVLTITGHVRDTVMVLIDGVLISKPLSSLDDLNTFGFWKLDNSNITLTTSDLVNVSLDLVIENYGRANYGNFFHQFKGLTPDNRVYLNDKELQSWVIFPLEFQKSWNTKLTDWQPAGDEPTKGPGMHKAVLNIDTYAERYNDTYIDMQEWNKGIVIVNGFVLGRYAFIGPQQALYLPGAYLQHGDNEIIIFEQFESAAQVKFSKDQIYKNP
ncbi:Beta-galactosidase-1-like protein 3 [Tribolium castaneum]|uniref:Beta-galactosidase-1-like protein 3 n=1 Tax=Tribolium castaneum TaxID=7070 RepID=D6WLG6_TRICA|nr:PREDICTED: beta-galactosidase-1-like protein 2 [Tribolium castaneum]EFA04110.1 Beta-galactosidase-1-like protein 3 [Tribolium castaneum]|eukprot:XP_968058.1 PREDICTED: beta-galactosidase-1-like protein 2 [Tribolium castaneum]